MVVTVDLSAGQAADDVAETVADTAERAPESLPGTVDHSAEALTHTLADISDSGALVRRWLVRGHLHVRSLHNR